MAVDEDAATMERSRGTSFLYAGNTPYVEELYEQYLTEPSVVTPEWRSYFDALRATPGVDGSARADVAHGPVVAGFVALAKRPAASAHSDAVILNFARKQVAVQSLIAAYRMVGTRQADLDPLRWTPRLAMPELEPAYHGLTDDDLDLRFSGAGSYFSEEDLKLADLVAALRDTYCGTLGVEYMHVSNPEQRRWWQMRLEPTRSRPHLAKERKFRILENLTAAEGLEKYLQTRFVGQQRFSLEGGEALIALLDELVQASGAHGVKQLILGMAHRGRLNVLLNTVRKPATDLFEEFYGQVDTDLLAGDVKYHLGYATLCDTDGGPVEVELAFNPSHLEIINPVLQGIARGKAEESNLAQAQVLPVEIHGDASVIAQGIVQETLNLSYTPGHGTSGTVHVVINNQVGFTTSDPHDARSTYYCTDIAKMIEAPVLHVNGDDPEAVVYAARLALDYRAEFGRSVVLELVCFRRHGHQEQDTPGITQPLMYRAVAAHPGVRTLYAQELVHDGLVTQEEVDRLSRSFREQMDTAHDQVIRERAARPGRSHAPPSPPSEVAKDSAVTLMPSVDQIKMFAERITQVPSEYELHPLAKKVLDARRQMAAGARSVDWGMGEHLAFATLLSAGVDIRLTGEDSERGTFGHRHAVLHNQRRHFRQEGRYLPLQHVGEEQGNFRVTNSTLSEAAVLAYEYGYSVTRPRALVLWEAQYGDFANGAQVVMDQFISAGFAKWGLLSSVVMLLPHGQEGQGAEHSSARLERYLQLCAQGNMLVCQPTTPAQFFHLLLAQALRSCCPLVVLTPKSLLRNAKAVSTLCELSTGSFAAVIGDSTLSAQDRLRVERIIVCTGKLYYELSEYRSKTGKLNAALIRLEQLYPFPQHELASELALFPNSRMLVWCQEEARNQGAWCYLESLLRDVAQGVSLRYAGPPPEASTSPGYPSVHLARQEALLHSAFGD